MTFSRWWTLGIGAVVLAACSVETSGPALDDIVPTFSQAKVDVCHRTAAGNWNLITVADPALATHIAHGDAEPGYPVPGGNGDTFAPDCSILAGPVMVYDNLPDPLPGNYVSLGYQATQTAEFGDGLALAGTERSLSKILVGMSSWACESGAWQLGTCQTTPGATFLHPITLNIYRLIAGTPASVGTLIATKTLNATIPYRPSATTDCGNAWGTTGNCFNGLAFVLEFDFSIDGVVLDDEVIITVEYNTQSYGDVPVGAEGPYNSLNVGLGLEGNAAAVGGNVDGAAWASPSGSPNWITYGYTPLLRVYATP